MNLLSTLYMLAQEEGTKAADQEASTPLFGPEGYIGTMQLIGIIVLIGLIIFYFVYKKKQQEG